MDIHNLKLNLKAIVKKIQREPSSIYYHDFEIKFKQDKNIKY